MVQVTLAQAQAAFAQRDDAAGNGARVETVQDGRPVAVLVGAEEPPGHLELL